MKPVVLILALIMIVSNEQLFAQCENDHVAGKDYRHYSNDKAFFNVSGCFEIVHAGDLIIYKQPGWFKTANTIFYYYSESLESPIYSLKYKKLRDYPFFQSRLLTTRPMTSSR